MTIDLKTMLEVLRGGPLPAPVEDRVKACVDAVMLDIAFTPVLEKAGARDPTEVTRREDGTYWLTYRNACCPDLVHYEAVREEDLKVMRARYLVTRADVYTRLRSMGNEEREHALRVFFNGGTWVPQERSALSVGFKMERADGTLDREE